jgi:hypothetical protein
MTQEPASESNRELMELWREWLTQSERQMNAFLNEAMGTEAAGRGMGSFVELYAVFQRNMAQAMERYLASMNIPSRTDITALAEKLNSIEERLSRIEETLLIAAESIDAFESREPAPQPARTRRPWEDDAPSHPDTPTTSGSVPEELRR